jgi:hypothetical protein
MANVLIIEAERFLDWDEGPPDPHGYFRSDEERQRCIQKAIEHAREIINEPNLIENAVVTANGSLMAMVRWNLELDTDPPIEVARFARPLVLC